MKSLGQALHVDSIIDHRFELASLDKQSTEWRVRSLSMWSLKWHHEQEFLIWYY